MRHERGRDEAERNGHEKSVPHNHSGISINVPLTLKKRAGRKHVLLPGAFAGDDPERLSYQEALVIAIARAHRWQGLLDEEKFESVSDLAREIGLDVSFAARLLRLTMLAPDIVEAILVGEEPSGLSLSRLTQVLPTIWEAQRAELAMGAVRPPWHVAHDNDLLSIPKPSVMPTGET